MCVYIHMYLYIYIHTLFIYMCVCVFLHFLTVTTRGQQTVMILNKLIRRGEAGVSGIYFQNKATQRGKGIHQICSALLVIVIVHYHAHLQMAERSIHVMNATHARSTGNITPETSGD